MIVEVIPAEVRAMVAGIFVATAIMVSLAWNPLGQEANLVSDGGVGEFPKLHSVRLWDRGTERLEAVIPAGMRRVGIATTPNN